jgi:hypothetical protein
MMMKHPYHRPVLKILGIAAPKEAADMPFSSCREMECTTNLGAMPGFCCRRLVSVTNDLCSGGTFNTFEGDSQSALSFFFFLFH